MIIVKYKPTSMINTIYSYGIKKIISEQKYRIFWPGDLDLFPSGNRNYRSIFTRYEFLNFQKCIENPAICLINIRNKRYSEIYKFILKHGKEIKLRKVKKK